MNAKGRTIVIGAQLIESVCAVRHHIKCPLSIYPIESIHQLRSDLPINDSGVQLVLFETNQASPNLRNAITGLQTQFPDIKIIMLPDSGAHPLHSRLVLAGILEAVG